MTEEFNGVPVYFVKSYPKTLIDSIDKELEEKSQRVFDIKPHAAIFFVSTTTGLLVSRKKYFWPLFVFPALGFIASNIYIFCCGDHFKLARFRKWKSFQKIDENA
eukprot:TRINITY_DN681_c2_g1_i1.p1 TRINITY_DN681_c2_g1~~TRINITY_DN681_c2_g1_i1.p1  ORF type:complete len:105 (-),score=26.06 TRINITY_DN681_c2_g1_i1:88-402(-)